MCARLVTARRTDGAQSVAALAAALIGVEKACLAACACGRGPPPPHMRARLAAAGAAVSRCGLCAEGWCGDFGAGLSGLSGGRGLGGYAG